MFEKLNQRLSGAWLLVTTGAPMEGLDYFLGGPPEDRFSIQTEKPLIADENFNRFIEKLGFEDFAPMIVRGQMQRVTLGEHDSQNLVELEVRTSGDENKPEIFFSIEGRFIDVVIIAKYDADKNRFQADYAGIVTYEDSGSGEVEACYNIPCDDSKMGRDTLPELLKVMADTGKAIMEAPEENRPYDYEMMLHRGLRPVIAEIQRYEEARYADFQAECLQRKMQSPRR
jgi:hypothetical protein